ncbi:MAG TPA: hypothetical protein VLS94_02495 [Fusibacter sp.]|nr:hypothetical protein [Fusibacter sp.]
MNRANNHRAWHDHLKSKSKEGNGSKKGFNPTEKSVAKYFFAPYDPSKTTKSYDAVKAKIIERIGHTFKQPKEIQESLETMNVVTIPMPTRLISNLPQPAERLNEQQGYNILYDNQVAVYMKRTKQLEDNLAAAYL